ncbi:MAG: hypothetical protein IPM64_17860 [Phycisphaerales bacterium]|nr:hypothetical protein [Phycisphaerales bacterium]
MSKIGDQRRQCTSKIPYQTQKEALATIRRARSRRVKRGGNVPTARHRPYRCPWCGRWHIGADKPNPKRPPQRRQHEEDAA